MKLKSTIVLKQQMQWNLETMWNKKSLGFLLILQLLLVQYLDIIVQKRFLVIAALLIHLQYKPIPGFSKTVNLNNAWEL